MESIKGTWLSAEEAMRHVHPGNRIIIPIGCGLPKVLIDALISDSHRLKGVEIVGGLQMEYEFLDESLADSFTFRTWQCTPAIRRFLGSDRVKYIPMRQSDAPYFFSQQGPWPVDVAFIHVTRPDSNGYCSLGVSVSILPMALAAKTIVAQVNDNMPKVFGAFIHVSQIDYLVESSRPLTEYPPAEAMGEKERLIGEYAAELIPDGAWIQTGIGAIPEGMFHALADKRNIKVLGLAADGIIDLVDKGVIEQARGESTAAPIVVGEALGTQRLFNFVHENPIIEGTPVNLLDPRWIGSHQNLVCVQGIIEIDLTGQVNSETIGGRQVSAVGGSFDWLLGSRFSDGGKSIMAMTSTTPNGEISKIVPQLPLGSAVTHPRQCVQYVVTEYGTANLYGKSLTERARELINVAHPDFRKELLASWNSSR